MDLESTKCSLFEIHISVKCTCYKWLMLKKTFSNSLVKLISFTKEDSPDIYCLHYQKEIYYHNNPLWARSNLFHSRGLWYEWTISFQIVVRRFAFVGQLCEGCCQWFWIQGRVGQKIQKCSNNSDPLQLFVLRYK